MSDALVDEAGAREVETIYLTPDVVAQGERVLGAAALGARSEYFFSLNRHLFCLRR